MSTLLIAMDRATVRRRDPNGFMHVEVSNISKANVCPYYGREIPNWQGLGLDPDKPYMMFRDPAELARAAETFNNIPILSRHVPVDAEELPDELIIGTTGNDSSFVGPYLQNRLAIWSARHQRAIENHTQKELSSAYRYRADMTPGVHEGLQYDGVMRDIIGNHVALVIEGRAGPDVVVGDGMMKLTSRTALMISGAVAALVRPKLAADAKVDISDALKGVDAKSFAMDGAPKKIAGAVAKLVKPHLAADAKIDADELTTFIAGVQPIALDEDAIEEKTAEDEDMDDDDVAQDEDKDDLAEDEDGDDDDKPAMDQATVRKMIAKAEKRGAERAAAIDTAKADVRPFVGEVIGQDSAESIYLMALDQAGYDKAALKGTPLVALKAMVAKLPKPGAPIATDGARYTGESKLAKILGGDLPELKRS